MGMSVELPTERFALIEATCAIGETPRITSAELTEFVLRDVQGRLKWTGKCRVGHQLVDCAVNPEQIGVCDSGSFWTSFGPLTFHATLWDYSGNEETAKRKVCEALKAEIQKLCDKLQASVDAISSVDEPRPSIF